MGKVVVLGGGRVGRFIAERLYTRGSTDNVTIVDNRPHGSIGCPPGVVHQRSHVEPTLLPQIIDQAALVVNALPGCIGYQTLKRIIECGKDCIDISFMPEDPRDLNDLALKNQTVAMVDMGVAPGLCGVFVGNEYYNTFQKCDMAAIAVGGLPFYPPDKYHCTFSPADIIEEYTRPARLRRYAEDISLPALTDIQPFPSYPFAYDGHPLSSAKMESFLTDGLRTLLELDIPNMEERTIRYQGYAQEMIALRELGYFEPDKLPETAKHLEKLWEPNLPINEITIMSIVMQGISHGGEFIRAELNLVDDTHRENFATSMARTTAMPAVAMAEMLIKKDYAAMPFGVMTPEDVGEDGGFATYIYDRLIEENVKLEITHTPLT